MNTPAKLSYEKPTTNKHKAVNVVQGSGLYRTTLYYTTLYYRSLYYVSLYHVTLYH